jgi:hypothetical protein
MIAGIEEWQIMLVLTTAFGKFDGQNSKGIQGI